jgi:alcohol dehydrogenase (NADP+)
VRFPQSRTALTCAGPKGWLATYNEPMIPAAQSPGKVNTYGRDNTYGGCSDLLMVKEDFLLKMRSDIRFVLD